MMNDDDVMTSAANFINGELNLKNDWCIDDVECGRISRQTSIHQNRLSRVFSTHALGWAAWGRGLTRLEAVGLLNTCTLWQIAARKLERRVYFESSHCLNFLKIFGCTIEYWIHNETAAGNLINLRLGQTATRAFRRQNEDTPKSRWHSARWQQLTICSQRI